MRSKKEQYDSGILKELYDSGVLREPEKPNKLADGLFYIFTPIVFVGLLLVLVIYC